MCANNNPLKRKIIRAIVFLFASNKCDCFSRIRPGPRVVVVFFFVHSSYVRFSFAVWVHNTLISISTDTRVCSVWRFAAQIRLNIITVFCSVTNTIDWNKQEENADLSDSIVFIEYLTQWRIFTFDSGDWLDCHWIGLKKRTGPFFDNLCVFFGGKWRMPCWRLPLFWPFCWPSARAEYSSRREKTPVPNYHPSFSVSSLHLAFVRSPDIIIILNLIAKTYMHAVVDQMVGHLTVWRLLFYLFFFFLLFVVWLTINPRDVCKWSFYLKKKKTFWS